MRWRDVKQNKIPKKKPKKREEGFKYATLLSRFKAFVTDMFLIMMPIAYAVTYLIMGSKEAFQSSVAARWSLGIVYGVIVIAFWVKTGQTPGYKAYEIKVIDKETKKPPNLIQATLRYLLFLISATFIVGIVMAYFRKDRQMFHDIFSKTAVVSVEK